MKVIIDPGHGGSDPGACAGALVEKDINLTVAIELKRLLELRGIECAMTRAGDKSVSLGERTQFANTVGGDICLSIHHNAGGGVGFDVIHSIYHGDGEYLAQLIADEFRTIGQVAHGVGVWSKQGNHGDYFAMVRDTHMPAVISEYAFLDSRDAARIDTHAELMAEAEALCQAIVKYRAEHNPVLP